MRASARETWWGKVQLLTEVCCYDCGHEESVQSHQGTKEFRRMGWRRLMVKLGSRVWLCPKCVPERRKDHARLSTEWRKLRPIPGPTKSNVIVWQYPVPNAKTKSEP